MICFQKIVSLFWRTTDNGYLQEGMCCDLLSKNCIFVLTNNKFDKIDLSFRVVICFQKIVSLFWRTTVAISITSAFCCDLLSKNCIFVLTNNKYKTVNLCFVVVICFQKIVSLFWRTTGNHEQASSGKLWFAFKKLYLCSDEQPHFDSAINTTSCDLLSKNCIFVLTNNLLWWDRKWHAVVICFQKIVSLFWRTTQSVIQNTERMLWFAFKKLYLCSDEQLILVGAVIYLGCDLLSKNCIFVLTNNIK